MASTNSCQCQQNMWCRITPDATLRLKKIYIWDIKVQLPCIVIALKGKVSDIFE